MNILNVKHTKKLLLVLATLFFCTQIQAQNEQISIQRISSQEFEVRSINGIPFTVVLEGTNNDGQYLLPSGGSVSFNTSDIKDDKSTLRIIFEEEMYHSLENELIDQYHSELKWIVSVLDVKEDDSKKFPSRPVFTDAGLEKLKVKLFEYTTTDKKEDYFNQWIEKINYSVGAVQYLRGLYAASNGADNAQRHNFLPIKINEELQK